MNKAKEKKINDLIMNSKELPYGLREAMRIIEQGASEFDRWVEEEGGPLKNLRAELIANGFCFNHLSDTPGKFMPEYKDTIVPLVMKYFPQARSIREKKFILRYMYFKGLYEVVPMLIDELRTCTSEREDLKAYDGDFVQGYGWEIGDTLYVINCRTYIQEYMEIIQNEKLGRSRQMVISMLGRMRCREAMPIVRSLIFDETIVLHTISCLGMIGDESCIDCLEYYTHSKNSAQRRFAKRAIASIERRTQKASKTLFGGKNGTITRTDFEK